MLAGGLPIRGRWKATYKRLHFRQEEKKTVTSVPSPESLHLGTGSGSSFRGVARSPTASRSRAADLCEGVSARGSNEEPPLPTAGRANNSFFSSLANGGCERRASGDRPRRGDRRPAPLFLSGPPLGSTGAEPRRGGSQKYDGDVGDDDQSVCTSAPRFWGRGGVDGSRQRSERLRLGVAVLGGGGVDGSRRRTGFQAEKELAPARTFHVFTLGAETK